MGSLRAGVKSDMSQPTWVLATKLVSATTVPCSATAASPLQPRERSHVEDQLSPSQSEILPVGLYSKGVL